jgi:hypothetical protein
MDRRKPETPARQQRRVDDWNRAHPVGTPVTVRKDAGEILETRTRSRAELLGGHTAVIWLDNVRGCYALERVQPAEPIAAGVR